MKRTRIALLLAIIASFLIVGAVFAQAGQLTLKLSRDWGYGGFNNDIEGLFSMRVTGPADLARVEYFIDTTKIGEVTQSPFNLQFTTGDYPLGSHQLSAVGYSTSGQAYSSNVITVTFVPKQSTLKFILPVLGVVFAAILLSAVVPLLARRGKHLSLPLGTERKYGVGGGGICPKCHRPFALPLLSANLGFSKLTSCPFCGKWGLVRVESIGKLREAERAELELVRAGEQIIGETEEEKLKKELDESKYKE